jgi:hypothetical protein
VDTTRVPQPHRDDHQDECPHACLDGWITISRLVVDPETGGGVRALPLPQVREAKLGRRVSRPKTFGGGDAIPSARRRAGRRRWQMRRPWARRTVGPREGASPPPWSTRPPSSQAALFSHTHAARPFALPHPKHLRTLPETPVVLAHNTPK